MKTSTIWEVMEFPDNEEELVGRVLEKYNCTSGLTGSGTSVCTDDCPAYGLEKKIVNIESYSKKRAIELGLE